MWKILINASTRPNHASFPHTCKIFNQQTMSHYICVVNTHQHTGANHATCTLAAHCFFFLVSFFVHYHFRNVFMETKPCLLLNFPWHWYTYSISYEKIKWKINAPVHMLQNWSFAEKPKLYKKKIIGSGMKNILLLMSLHLKNKKSL